MDSGGGTVTNCILIGNLATNSAGGGADRVYTDQLSDCGKLCRLWRRRLRLHIDQLHRGEQHGQLVRAAACLAAVLLARVFSLIARLVGNSASSSGGGAYGGTLNRLLDQQQHCEQRRRRTCGSILNNCLVSGNNAASGGGIYGGMVTNCTVVFNVATNSGGGIFGASGAWCYNSILYYNIGTNGVE